MAVAAEDPRSSLEDCTCPICISIMIFPVTMPCTHELCMPCFKHNVEESSLLCPLCRRRISTWTRLASRTNTLVNESRWKQIRELFPERVQRRLDGKDEDANEETFHHPPVHLAAPGEIRKEYEEELHKLRLQRLAERQKEAEESAKLIARLAQEEDDVTLQRQLELARTVQLDEAVAQELNEIINNENAPSTSTETLRFTGSSSSASTSSSLSDRSTLVAFFSPKVMKAKDPYPYSCISPADKEKEDKSDGLGSVVDTASGRGSASAREDFRLFDTSDHTYCPPSHSNKPSTVGRPPSREGEGEGSSTEQISSSTSQRPLCREQRPPSREQRPLSREQRPPSREQRPSSREQRPSSREQRPPSREQRPLSREQRLSSREQRPPSREQRPPNTGQKSASTVKRPPSKERSPPHKAKEPLSTDIIALLSPPPVDRREKRDDAERSASTTSSNDSINNELSHFKPITACPRTPPRKLANGVLVDPPVVRTTPRNLSRNDFSPLHEPSSSSSGLDPGSPFMQRRLLELAEERKQMVKERSKSTSTAAAIPSRVDDMDQHLVGCFSAEDVDGLENLVRRPLHKHLDQNSDANPATNPPAVESKTSLLIPMESIIEDDDLIDVPSLFPRLKPEETKNLCNEKENVIQPSSSGASSTERSKLQGSKSSKNTTNKNREPKSRKKTLTSPQRSIKDWLINSEKRSEGACISPDLFPNDSNSSANFEPVSKADDSLVSESSKLDSYIDRNANERFKSKHTRYIQLDEDSNDSDCEVVFSIRKADLQVGKNDLVKDRGSLADHGYHKDITSTVVPVVPVTSISIPDQVGTDSRDISKSCSTLCGDISMPSHSNSKSLVTSKKDLQSGKLFTEEVNSSGGKNAVAECDKNKHLNTSVSSRGRLIKKKSYPSDDEDDSSEEFIAKSLLPKKTVRCKMGQTLKKKVKSGGNENTDTLTHGKATRHSSSLDLVSRSTGHVPCVSSSSSTTTRTGKVRSHASSLDSSVVQSDADTSSKIQPGEREGKKVSKGRCRSGRDNSVDAPTEGDEKNYCIQHDVSSRSVPKSRTRGAAASKHRQRYYSGQETAERKQSRKKRKFVIGEDVADPVTPVKPKPDSDSLQIDRDEWQCSSPKKGKTSPRKTLRSFIKFFEVLSPKKRARKKTMQTSNVSELPTRGRRKRIPNDVHISDSSDPEKRTFGEKKKTKSYFGISESFVAEKGHPRKKLNSCIVDVPQCSNTLKRRKRPRKTLGKTTGGSVSVRKTIGSKKNHLDVCKSPTHSEVSQSLSQEDHDGVIARKLQKQFDLEVKLKLVEGRFKGTDKQYYFRREPKYS
ncbi:microtubule-associated protein futsch-like [Gigantopelta aegis]|uniref:microtubule-associated protein futsch-like n=1 Tax=Gigantopelta aegis TaxID=1735272 RepID=UPI001B88B46C|nr:microtubule-associated protein futsch-like [Gigantopelta aegis]